jgi:hypothetical protein
MVPQMASEMARNIIDSELTKRTFFRKHPQLKGHEKSFEPFLAAYRQLPQNRGRGFNEVSDEAAIAYQVRHRIATPQAQPTPPVQNAPPPPPPMGATAPAAPQQNDFWGQFAEEIDSEEF